jgi:hypothetical protein
MFEDSEEGAAQLYPDPVCLQQILEQFRYAYVKKSRFSRVAHSFPYIGNWTSNITLSDGNTYSKINVLVMNNVNSQPFKIANSPQSSYKWGNVMKINVDDKHSDFYSYLFPTEEDWNQQIDNLVQRVVSENDQSKKISTLAILPYPEYDRFTNSQLIENISLLMDGYVTSDYLGCENNEQILYNLVASLSNEGISDFINIFEPQLVDMLNRFQGVYSDSIFLKLSQYITYAKGTPSAIETFAYNMRTDGSCYNKVFYWEESLGIDLLYETRLSSLSNTIPVSVRNTGWFSESTYLMSLSPTDFVGIYAKTPMPALGLGDDQMVLIPAIKFHWLCKQRNKEEAWKRFFQGVDVAITIGTMGTYGAAKTFKQVGTTYAIGMAMDYTIRLAINSLYYDTMDEAIANTSLLDAGWNAANVFVTNPQLAVVLPCVREFAKAYFVDDLGVGESVYECGRSLVLSLVSKKVFPTTGAYANKIKTMLQQQPRKTVAKLRDIGVDKESMLSLARLLFDSTTDQIYDNVKSAINEAYE